MPPSAEPIIDPELPIVDAHVHLWMITDSFAAMMEAQESRAAKALATLFKRQRRYLMDEHLLDVSSGHNIIASVYTDCGAMYRATGPDEMKSVGEIEFANGVAAMGASGLFGPTKVCAAISGGVDLKLGKKVEPVLHAHIRAGGDRYRGFRTTALYDDDVHNESHGGVPHVLAHPGFREGFSLLHPLGLSFEAMLFEPQLPELLDLARSFPQTQIILNHLGGPLGVGRYAGKREERYPIWKENIYKLAACPNIAVKLGGIGMAFAGFPSFLQSPPASSTQLASEWKPYIETCIEAFGVDRCMFEANFPVDSNVGSYATIWNTFKRLTAGASSDEKTALFSGTATRLYRLDL